MAIQDSTFPLQDSILFSDDVNPEDVDVNNHNDDDSELLKETSSSSLMSSPVYVTDEDLRWSEDELTTLFQNETKQLKPMKLRDPEAEMAVKWMMRVVAHYGFNPTTAILAVDYFDRFITTQQHHRHCIVEKLWTLQLAAVACLSLAAKVEESEAPLPLDLQVEDAKFMFESKTIQRMELLVLSTLQWRMRPVTPFSFIDHIVRRLWMEHGQQLEFLDHSSRILTSIVTDSRWGLYPSSALACATMIHVMEGCSNSIDEDYQNQLFSALITINKEKVSECCELINELMIHHKRKVFTTQVMELGSLKAVIDHASSYSLLTEDSSNDSWDLSTRTTTTLLQLEPSPTSSELPALKRARYNDDDDVVKDHNLVELG